MKATLPRIPLAILVVALHASTLLAQVPDVVKWISVQTDKQALVFAPGEVLSTTLKIAAGAGKSVNWVAIDQAEKELTRAVRPISLAADAPTLVPIDLGKRPEGLYVVRLAMTDNKGEVQRTSVMLAALPPPSAAPEDASQPFFPVGVYDKYIINRDRVVSNTYLHAICWTLKRAGLNCITSGNTLLPPTVEQLDIAASWGIKVLIRTDMCDDPKALNHPNVPALMYGDEPKVENIESYKKQYDEMKAKYPNKALLTCMVGDSVGARVGGDPAVLWNALKPTVRFVRYYPIRKEHYDLLHRRLYSGGLPANAVFQLIDSYDDTPWWFVSQTFGMIATETRPDTFWANPSPAELSGLTHLALAHGARGLMGWALQTHWQQAGNDVPCLLKQETLTPADGKWQTWLDITNFAKRFKPILLAAKRGGCEPGAERAELEVVARQTSDGRRFVYVVNMDTRATVESDFWIFDAQVMAIRDLVDDRELALTTGRWDRPVAHIKLKPGEGRIFEIKMMTGPIAAAQINTGELLPFNANPIVPMGPDENENFTQVQALPAWWRFALDPDNVGQDKQWFAANFDDSGWGYLRVGKFWDRQGVKIDKSQAWYRMQFTPSQDVTVTKPVKLLFMGVDESAWVYLNGELICTHYPDNTDGWDRSFAIDVTDKLKPGVPNVLAVRVFNRTAAGGIYGKVALVKTVGPRPEVQP